MGVPMQKTWQKKHRGFLHKTQLNLCCLEMSFGKELLQPIIDCIKTIEIRHQDGCWVSKQTWAEVCLSFPLKFVVFFCFLNTYSHLYQLCGSKTTKKAAKLCWQKDRFFQFLSNSQVRSSGSLSTLGEHVSQLEQRVGANEDNLDQLSTRVKQLEKITYLMDKVEDLENRSRSANLRFVRVPESAEGRHMIGYMARLIPQLGAGQLSHSVGYREGSSHSHCPAGWQIQPETYPDKTTKFSG